MTRASWILALVQMTVLAGFLAGVAGRWFPLGVPGEWEWLRLPATARVDPIALGTAGAAIIGLAALAGLGARSLSRPATPRREAGWVAGLAVAAVVAQAVVQEGAPEGYGLAKWIIALRNEGSSGYQSVARAAMPAGLGPFLRDYPAWIARQDSLHIGTHPPGLFVAARGMVVLARTHPELARWVVDHAPGSVAAMIRATRAADPLARDEAAALVLTGALTLLGSALTVVPLYLAVRAGAPAGTAWAASTLWPLVPAALLFQPTADTAFPLLAAAALAAAAWAVVTTRPGWAARLAIAAGLILAVGMELTLVYLAVGVVVALVLIGSAGTRTLSARLGLVGWTGLGFAAATLGWWGITGANPAAIWWVNQAHHAQFYRDYPRSRWRWTGANLGETAAAIGLGSSVLAVWGGLRPRLVPAAGWASVAVLVLLTLTGRSLSEVARLWLPLFPPLLALAALGWARLGARPMSLSLTVALSGVQALVLQTLIQVVYPI